MKIYIIITLFFTFSGIHSQGIGINFLGETSGGRDSIQVMGQLDSLKLKASLNADTINQKLTLKKEKLNKWKKLNRADTIVTGIQFKSNSLISNGKPTGKLDSAKLIIQYRVDSLGNSVISVDKYQQKVDSLSSKTSGFLGEKRQTVSDKLDDKGISTELIEKTEMNLTITELSKVNTSDIGLNKTVSEMPVPEVNMDMGLTDMDIPQLNPDISNPLKDDLNLGNSVDDVKYIDALKSASKKIDEAEEITGHIGEYQETFEEIKIGDLQGVDLRIEDGLKNLDEVQELQENLGEFESLQTPENPMADLEKFKDQEALKNELVDQGRKQVTEHLTNQTEKLQGAFELLTKYKKKYHSLESIKKPPKKRTTYLDEEPFITRLLPGVSFEVSRKDIIRVDAAPSFGYKLTDRWSVHGSYLYRFHFNSDDEKFDWNQTVYGPRIDFSYSFFKGYFVQASADRLRTYVPVAANSESSRKWVNGTYLGLGKQVRFRKRVVSNVSFNYNFLYDEKQSPFVRKFNIRFVFDFELRIKRVNLAKKQQDN